MVEIRSEKPEDIALVRHVHQQAFHRANEARLVELLRAAGKARLSLVAEQDGQVVAHLLFSPVTLDPARPDLRFVGLAPVGVLPESQKQGIGSRLIREGLKACREAGYEAVVVLGDPAFYSRFGCSCASAYGLGNEYGADEDFMVVELRQGALAGITGTVKYQPEFGEANC